MTESTELNRWRDSFTFFPQSRSARDNNRVCRRLFYFEAASPYEGGSGVSAAIHILLQQRNHQFNIVSAGLEFTGIDSPVYKTFIGGKTASGAHRGKKVRFNQEPVDRCPTAVGFAVHYKFAMVVWTADDDAGRLRVSLFCNDSSWKSAKDIAIDDAFAPNDDGRLTALLWSERVPTGFLIGPTRNGAVYFVHIYMGCINRANPQQLAYFAARNRFALNRDANRSVYETATVGSRVYAIAAEDSDSCQHVDNRCADTNKSRRLSRRVQHQIEYLFFYWARNAVGVILNDAKATVQFHCLPANAVTTMANERSQFVLCRSPVSPASRSRSRSPLSITCHESLASSSSSCSSSSSSRLSSSSGSERTIFSRSSVSESDDSSPQHRPRRRRRHYSTSGSNRSSSSSSNSGGSQTTSNNEADDEMANFICYCENEPCVCILQRQRTRKQRKRRPLRSSSPGSNSDKSPSRSPPNGLCYRDGSISEHGYTTDPPSSGVEPVGEEHTTDPLNGADEPEWQAEQTEEAEWRAQQSRCYEQHDDDDDL